MDWPRWLSVVTNGGLHAQRVWGPYSSVRFQSMKVKEKSFIDFS